MLKISMIILRSVLPLIKLSDIPLFAWYDTNIAPVLGAVNNYFNLL